MANYSSDGEGQYDYVGLQSNLLLAGHHSLYGI